VVWRKVTISGGAAHGYLTALPSFFARTFYLLLLPLFAYLPSICA